MRILLTLTLTWILSLTFLTPTAMAAKFQLGFASIAGQIGHIAGVPIEDEWHASNGDGLQRTTTGLMVWRKADNWTAFTNGSRTWVNGPNGIQERSNDERFPWEFDDRKITAQTINHVPFDVAAEDAALNMINASRAQFGVAALTMDGALRTVARSHSRDMGERNYFSHNSPEGASFLDRMRSAGIRFGHAAENLGFAKGYGDNVEAVRKNHEAMMAEVPPNDGHRRNILSSRYKKVGIGVYRTADGRIYYTCDFTD